MIRQTVVIIACAGLLSSCAWFGFKKKTSLASPTPQQETVVQNDSAPVPPAQETPDFEVQVSEEPAAVDQPVVTETVGADGGPDVIVCSVC